MITSISFISGVFTGTEEDWQRHLYDTWFGMYDRARAILGSSGFEHVFIGEIKNGAVSGFHNWFHWYMLEQAGELNYLGYWETAEFGPDMEVKKLMIKKDLLSYFLFSTEAAYHSPTLGMEHRSHMGQCSWPPPQSWRWPCTPPA
jgi:hypothetical protein